MMADSKHVSEIRSDILSQLHHRNEKENKAFADIVYLSNTLFESVDFLQKENIRLTVQKAKVEQENLELQVQCESGVSKPSEKTSVLEKKIYHLQEELTELHRKKGEYAQQVIDLRNALDDKEKELVAKNIKLQEAELALIASNSSCKNLQHKVSEVEFNLQDAKEDEKDRFYRQLQDILNSVKKGDITLVLSDFNTKVGPVTSIPKLGQTYDLWGGVIGSFGIDSYNGNGQCLLQLVKDEHDALLITYSSLEEKKQKLEKEHQELISRWMSLKARDADKLNAETERIQRLKQAQLQKELEEAAREPVAIDSSRFKNVPLCVEASIPRKMLYKFDAHDGEVNAVTWTSSGAKLATGGGDRKVKLWEIALGQSTLKGILTESNSSVMSVDFDSEETFVLGASCDFASRVWTVNDLKLRHTLTGHSGKVMAAKFLGESSKVVSGSHDRTLKIWDLRRRACIRTIFAGSSCNDIVTSVGAGTNIISGHFDKRIRFWDTRSESSANEILLQGKITSLDISVDGISLLSCVRDDTLKLLDLRMNQVIRTFAADGFMVGCDWTRAKFSPDGQYCTAGSQDGSVIIWVVSTGKVEKILKEHSSTVTSCAWSPSGSYLASCDRNKKVILWSDF